MVTYISIKSTDNVNGRLKTRIKCQQIQLFKNFNNKPALSVDRIASDSAIETDFNQ